MKLKNVCIGLLCVTIKSSLAQPSPELQRRPDEAERRILRLPPTAFPALPRSVVRELQRRACTIPQVAGFNKRRNVIQGEFAKPDQKDWAVLCAKAGFVEL